MQQHNPGALIQFEATEDATGSAGWMFSDMLVALMVVFLATITFIPQFAGSSSTTGSDGTQSQTGGAGSYTYTEHFAESMIRAYTKAQVENVAGDVKIFLKNNNLPANAIIDSAQFVGGYNASETAAEGITRALDFSNALAKANPTLLEHASTILNTSPKLSPALVTLRFTFSSQVTTNK